jgi:hypothetical protein
MASVCIIPGKNQPLSHYQESEQKSGIGFKSTVVNFPLVYGPMTDVPQNIKVCSHLVLGTVVI